MNLILPDHSNKFVGRPLVLLILDGFGLLRAEHPGNAITKEIAPNIFQLMEDYPTAELETHGESVGLFANQKGNSEAGHMCIGAGRVVKQDIVRISDAIATGTFYHNPAFVQGIEHIKKYNSSAHVMTLLTDGHSAHAYPEHLYALLDLFHQEKIERVYLHLFTDGRDTPPHFAGELLRKLREEMYGNEKIATVIGRFYAMDRAKHWERTRLAYEAINNGVGVRETDSAESAIMLAYNRNLTDEYVEPTVIMENDQPVAKVEDNDAIFFVNARSDRGETDYQSVCSA